MRGCSSARRRLPPPRQPRFHRRGRRSRDDRNAVRMGFQDPSHVSAPSAAGITAASAPRAARGPRAPHQLMPALLMRSPPPPIPTPPLRSSTASFRICRPACSSSRCFSPIPQLLDLVAAIAARRRGCPIIWRARRRRSMRCSIPISSPRCREPDLDRTLGISFRRGQGFEGALDGARRFAREQIFRIGVQLIQGRATARCGARLYPDRRKRDRGAAARVADELARARRIVAGRGIRRHRHGQARRREMTAGSDLDLSSSMMRRAVSNGAKPVAAHLLRAPGAALHRRADRRDRRRHALRGRHAAAPRGNKGPVAVSLEAFRRYQATMPGPGSVWL